MSDSFILGVVVGLAIGLGMWAIAAAAYRSVLIAKAKPMYRTPERIGDGFYYIIPEAEYVHLITGTEAPQDSFGPMRDL